MLGLFGFVDGLIQMLHRFFATSMEVALGMFQLLSGAVHHFDRLVDAGEGLEPPPQPQERPEQPQPQELP
jgi:hypothetical protein